MPANSASAKKKIVLELKEGILTGDRSALARAITLTESSLDKDRIAAGALLDALLPYSGRSIRIGITGSPGVGKSTFIDAFGTHLTSTNHRVAVLAIDPSSQKTKGSILGDKTRMEQLSKDSRAFIRPTASGARLGGVAQGTRESILLCEAAGYSIILVETVGVGQSDVAVRSMVDFFLLLQLGGSGDELQGIKKGIMEMADAIAITKADGDNISKTTQAVADFQQALHLFRITDSGWSPKVVSTSAVTGEGLTDVWNLVEAFRAQTTSNGFFKRQRERQQLEWFHSLIDERIREKIWRSAKKSLSALEKKIVANRLSPLAAAEQVLARIKF